MRHNLFGKNKKKHAFLSNNNMPFVQRNNTCDHKASTIFAADDDDNDDNLNVSMCLLYRPTAN